MIAVGTPGPGRSQDPGTPSRSTTWAAGTQALGLRSTAFPGTSAANWVESGTAGV